MERLPFQHDSLYYGDCLDVMLAWRDSTPDVKVDLIYLDPPFHSQANYNFGTKNSIPMQVRAFSDTWKWDVQAARRVEALRRTTAHSVQKVMEGLWTMLGESGMLAYLSYMVQRLAVMKELLSDKGSMYLHCDSSACHYLKIVMDGIFGAKNFQNDFIWYYSGGGASKRRWARKHDVLLFYAFDGNTFNVDAVRTGHKWTDGQLRADGSPRDQRGKLPDDVWEHHALLPWSRENLGYPTQKPLALLERIIEASSNPDDVVLDPFCGCGTTLFAARRLRRRWIGIDVSPFATRLIRDVRFKDYSIPIYGIPTDMEGARELLTRNPLDFEAWMVTAIPGLAANEIQVGDRGIDGRGVSLYKDEEGRNLVLVQVKGGGVTVSALRDFKYVLQKNKALAGVFITLERVCSRRMRTHAAELGTFTLGATLYSRIQFWSTEEYFEGLMPELPPMADPYTGKPVQLDMFVQKAGL